MPNGQAKERLTGITGQASYEANSPKCYDEWISELLEESLYQKLQYIITK